ncbi:MAG: hypothetical protein IOB84_13475 [Brevundimonas sp.]|nr:hypothetical protein [Brevundimonas sp.]
MSNTLNIEPWHVATSRYDGCLSVDRAMLSASRGDLGEEWERAHRATSDAVDRVIDTPARSLGQTIAKLRIIIRHAHLEGPSDDIDDPAVREAALADRTRDGAWPLLRLLDDLERMLPSADRQPSEALRIAAGLLHGWEAAERQALDAGRIAEPGSAADELSMMHLSGLDVLLERSVRTAADVRAATLDDLRHKHRILEVLTRCSRWGETPLEDWEQDFIASIADDAARLTRPNA